MRIHKRNGDILEGTPAELKEFDGGVSSSPIPSIQPSSSSKPQSPYSRPNNTSAKKLDDKTIERINSFIEQGHKDAFIAKELNLTAQHINYYRGKYESDRKNVMPTRI